MNETILASYSFCGHRRSGVWAIVAQPPYQPKRAIQKEESCNVAGSDGQYSLGGYPIHHLCDNAELDILNPEGNGKYIGDKDGCGQKAEEGKETTKKKNAIHKCLRKYDGTNI